MIPKKFFKQDRIELAKALLGMELMTKIRGKVTSGIIVEVEAYGGPDDPACHAFSGKSERNQHLFLESGYSYVYFIYGMYYCVNVVTGPEGVGEAVLIRALEPKLGIETMQKRRGLENLKSLTSGPGKLCLALGIDRKLSGKHLLSSDSIKLLPGKRVPQSKIAISKRIGITKAADLPWRFYVKDSKYLSHK